MSSKSRSSASAPRARVSRFASPTSAQARAASRSRWHLNFRDAEIFATDISAAALEVAQPQRRAARRRRSQFSSPKRIFSTLLHREAAPLRSRRQAIRRTSRSSGSATTPARSPRARTRNRALRWRRWPRRLRAADSDAAAAALRCGGIADPRTRPQFPRRRSHGLENSAAIGTIFASPTTSPVFPASSPPNTVRCNWTFGCHPASRPLSLCFS